MYLCICGPRIFGITPPDAAHISDTFDGLSPPVIMSNLNKFGSFTLEGGGGGGGGGGWRSTPSCYAQHTYIYFHFFQNRATHFGRCPMLPSPPSNTKHSVDQPCTYDIPLNTKHIVDLYHALTSMSCDVFVHMQCNYAIVYLYHATYKVTCIYECYMQHHHTMDNYN